ncbi:ral interacting protein isoform X2 [Arctopsyche grandis]|uniref:ral interacting protein isoform X2 n=1 Tax=Arctopsyche grandis TaxID=121162 RepID=UPI00406D65C3
MEFDNEDGFPGLYHGEPGKRNNDSDYSDDGEKPSKKDLLIGRRKDKKESKKDRGYAALEGESSPEEETETNPSKSKKSKTFKFPSKSKEKREKSRDKEKVGEKELKEKEKEQLEKEKKKEKLKKEKEKRDKVKEKEREEKNKNKELKDKEKLKDKDKDKKEKKSSKLQPAIAVGVPFEEIFTLGITQPIFGVPLGLAVERSRCHDDTNLPLVIRDCIDYLQEHGLQSELLYRAEPPKPKMQTLKQQYTDRELISDSEYDIPTACGLLKLFISELPEPVLTTELCSTFEDMAKQPTPTLGPLVAQLPTSNRALLGWLITHFTSVLSHEKTNKLNIQTLGTLLGPTLDMSTNLLSTFISNSKTLFPDIILSRYVPPLTSTARLPENVDDIKKELRKQESLLSQIHAEMHAGSVCKKREEQLWEGQRIVTQLKRKLRSVQKSFDVPNVAQTQLSIDEKQSENIEKTSQNETAIQSTSNSSEDIVQQPAKIPTTSIPQNESKAPFLDKATNDTETDGKISFPTGSFEDNFENFDEITESITTNSNKNDMTDSMYSTSSETAQIKDEKPTLSEEELQLMRSQLEHAEYLQLKSILQAKINSERFEIVKLRSHMAIKNKQENNVIQMQNAKDVANVQNYTDSEIEERHRLLKENMLLEQKRLSLANQIFQERMSCVQLKIQIAMNEIL